MENYSLEHFWIFSEDQLIAILQHFQSPLYPGKNRLAAIQTCLNHCFLKYPDRWVVQWPYFSTLVELSSDDFKIYYNQIIGQEPPENRGTAIRNLWQKFQPVVPPEKTATVVCIKVADIRPGYQDLKKWIENPNHVYIGRKRSVFIDGVRFPEVESLWANPYPSKKYEKSTIPLFEMSIRKKLATGEIPIPKLLELRGKKLGCFCKLHGADIPCHGDILVKLLAEHVND